MFAICLLIVSCAYQFSGAGKMPLGITKISVSAFDNATSETGIEIMFANDLITELGKDLRVTLSPKDQAEAVLKGYIRSMDAETISRKKSYISLERRVTIVLDLKLTRVGGDVLWQMDGLRQSETYLVSNDKIATEQNLRNAISKISKKTAEMAYQSLMAGF
jgi:hypothetical protein